MHKLLIYYGVFFVILEILECIDVTTNAKIRFIHQLVITLLHCYYCNKVNTN